MKLIVGLGNPGSQYAKTRHNIGFIVLDTLADKLGSTQWHFEKRFNAEIAEVELDGEKILLAKPQTFMNDSGQSVRAILDFYKESLTPAVLWVIHDDIDLDEDEVLTKIGGSSGGQKGVQSIIDHIGTTDFHRIRIGIGRNDRNKDAAEKYVMYQISQATLATIQDVETFNKILAFVKLHI